MDYIIANEHLALYKGYYLLHQTSVKSTDLSTMAVIIKLLEAKSIQILKCKGPTILPYLP